MVQEVRKCPECGKKVLGEVITQLGCTGDIWVCSACTKQINTLHSNRAKKI